MASGSILEKLPNANYYKYSTCVRDITEREVRRAFRWLYQGGNSYVGDYLKTLERGMSRLGSLEKTCLEKGASDEDFDISFLYKLVQRCCGLAKDNDSIWNEPEESQKESLEHTFYCLKMIRNSLCHTNNLKFMTSEELEVLTDELALLLTRMLKLAGERAGKGEEASKCCEEVVKDLKAIRTQPIPSGLTKEKFADLARQELRDMPSLEGDFADVEIQKTSLTTTLNAVPVLILDELLKWPCEDSKVPDVIVVTGDTGTGKTSLCRYIFHSWRSGAENIIELQEYDLLLSIQCSDVCTSDLIQMLESALPVTMTSCDRYEACKLLPALKVLWLVDGFEEATREAKVLLKHVIEKRGSLHTILLTTRPEHTFEFTYNIPSGNNVLEVQLLGLSVKGRESVVNKLLRDSSTVSKMPQDFDLELRRLGPDVSRELLNPLKLTLTVSLWKEGIINMKEGGTLPQLYSAIKRKHTESLCEKTKMKSTMTADECERKVKKWTEALCKEAFEMTKSQKYVQLSEESLKVLTEASDNLRLFREHCFSTFLSYCPTFDTKDGIKCSRFLHSTQQFHFAAEYVLARLAECTESNVVCELFNGNTQAEVANQFYTVLLHVLALLPSSENIRKPHLTKLVKMLSQCKRCRWFEVIHYAAYAEDIISEACNYIPNYWGILDDDVKAAKHCLNYKVPDIVMVNIHGDPENIEEFVPMIRMIADRPILVSLILRYHCYDITHDKTSDSILEVLCNENAVCKIFIFHGCITTEVFSCLRSMVELQDLYLKIKNNKDLHYIIKAIKPLQQLYHFRMIMAMKHPKVQKCLAIPHQITVDLSLPMGATINDIKSLSVMSRAYNNIQIFNLPPEQTYDLINKLDRLNIKVENLTWVCHPEGKPLQFEFHYGPVPLEYPPEVFFHMSNFYISVMQNTKVKGGK